MYHFGKVGHEHLFEHAHYVTSKSYVLPDFRGKQKFLVDSKEDLCFNAVWKGKFKMNLQCLKNLVLKT